ncbi:FkbM family methyltransferase [Jannaschia sp. S6380]|uniref:FkbM family methyltransferase n=1 Tax=Jannaschia sp. S6380 TaxID=2926408 RepID=UPI001FF5B2E5|nr:FkbM family methyltransferase [Jannaschia sp. S6380]MCK0167021.1 FkbM family methyltransferase [Jannaschia sp. S6380]
MGLKRTLRRIARDRGWRMPRAILRQEDLFVRGVADTLTRADVVLDLGAHIGQVSQEFAQRAGRVYAFEPHPETYRALCHNTRNYPRIETMNKAVSDETGTARLFFDDAAEGKFTEGSTLVTDKANVTYETGAEVETIRLADFVTGLGKRVRLVKMDIEGAEYRVIADLVETPAIGQIDKIYVETHEDRIPALRPERDRVEARIAALGLQDRFDFNWP